MIKRIFIKNCYASNNLIDDFKNTGLILLSYCILLRNTVTERNLIRLSKSINKKESNLLTDNSYCFFSNRYRKNTKRCIYMLKRTNIDLIF